MRDRRHRRGGWTSGASFRRWMGAAERARASLSLPSGGTLATVGWSRHACAGHRAPIDILTPGTPPLLTSSYREVALARQHCRGFFA